MYIPVARSGKPPKKGAGLDPARSRREAARRASVMIRRQCTEHRLTRMVTLTFAVGRPEDSRSSVVADVLAFFRRATSKKMVGKWIAVLELHPGGHGWHVHCLVDRYVPQERLQALWGLGIVDVRKIRSKTGGGRESARVAARYAAKYVAKDSERERPLGEHRYLRCQGMAIKILEIEGSWPDMIRALSTLSLGHVSWIWFSGHDPEWTGPPTLAVRWS